ncbi:MAG: cellulase family glycosylhydrolase [Marinilabiliaceae bacterium]
MRGIVKTLRAAALALVSLLPVCLVSCSDSDGGSAAPEVTIGKKTIEFEAEGGEQNVAIRTNVDLKLTPSADWVTVEAATSTSQAVKRYNIICQPCQTGEDRECKIAVEADGFTDAIAVTQKAGSVISIVGESAYEVSGDGEVFTVTVNANGEPSFSASSSWLSLSGSVVKNTDGTYSASVKATKNFGAAREGGFQLLNGEASVSFTVKQAEGEAGEISGMPDDPVLVPVYMGMGWNLGNQLDAWNNEVANETCWGNGKCTQATMDAIRAAGFRTVRIPVTWLGKVGEAPDYKIDADWLARVAEVVGYAENAGLNAIINIHHDGADSKHWLDIKTAATTTSKNDAVKAQLKAMWTQIAEKFADKGNFLIFECMNEIHDGGWGWGANKTDGGKQYKTLNEWLQVCVDAIRATGGNNATRWIGVPGYCTNPDITLENLVVPTDAANRLMVAVHFYDPSDYTLEDKYSEWGHNGSKSKKASWGDEENVRTIFSKLQAKYVSAGTPVYIGEIGNVHRSTERAEAFRRYYLEYVCKAAKSYGMAPIFWDNGSASSGKECSGIFNHATGAALNNGATIASIMVNAIENDDADYTLQSVYDKTTSQY